MSTLADALDWLVAPEQHQGDGSIAQRILEHLGYTGIAVGIAAVIAVPLGYLIGHTRRGIVFAVSTAGAARALPTFGLLLLLVVLWGVSLREWAAIAALVILAIPSLLAGAYSGVGQIDPVLIDAARSQGMTQWQVLFRVEIPLSLPVLIGSLRNATLQVIATAPLVAYVGLGGLGYDLLQGIPLRRFDQVVGSAILIAALALVIDGLLSAVGSMTIPRGVRVGQRVQVNFRRL